jgi:Holliday junction resolvasome RuvABC DNA-binding subunit
MLVYNEHLLFNIHGMNIKIKVYKWNLAETCLRNLKSVDSLVIITEKIWKESTYHNYGFLVLCVWEIVYTFLSKGTIFR